MSKRGPCLLCGRPLPQRRWWQWTWLIAPPPQTCQLDADLDECARLWIEHSRAARNRETP